MSSKFEVQLARSYVLSMTSPGQISRMFEYYETAGHVQLQLVHTFIFDALVSYTGPGSVSHVWVARTVTDYLLLPLEVLHVIRSALDLDSFIELGNDFRSHVYMSFASYEKYMLESLHDIWSEGLRVPPVYDVSTAMALMVHDTLCIIPNCAENLNWLLFVSKQDCPALEGYDSLHRDRSSVLTTQRSVTNARTNGGFALLRIKCENLSELYKRLEMILMSVRRMFQLLIRSEYCLNITSPEEFPNANGCQSSISSIDVNFRGVNQNWGLFFKRLLSHADPSLLSARFRAKQFVPDSSTSVVTSSASSSASATSTAMPVANESQLECILNVENFPRICRALIKKSCVQHVKLLPDCLPTQILDKNLLGVTGDVFFEISNEAVEISQRMDSSSKKSDSGINGS